MDKNANTREFFDRFTAYGALSPRASRDADKIVEFLKQRPIYYDAYRQYLNKFASYDDPYKLRRLSQEPPRDHVRNTALYYIVSGIHLDNLPRVLQFLVNEGAPLHHTRIFMEVLSRLGNGATDNILGGLMAGNKHMASVENFATMLIPPLSAIYGHTGYGLIVLTWQVRVKLIKLFIQHGDAKKLLKLKYKGHSFLYTFLRYNYVFDDETPMDMGHLLFTRASATCRVHPNILKTLLAVGFRFQRGEVDKLIQLFGHLPSIVPDPWYRKEHLGYLSQNLHTLKALRRSETLQHARDVLQVLDHPSIDLPRDVAVSIVEKTTKLSPRTQRTFADMTRHDNVVKAILRKK